MNFSKNENDENGINFKNILTKTRREKGKPSELLVANDILNLEAVRFSLKTPFDRNIVTQFETQETLLDYGFAHLGVEDLQTHPVVITEALGNPNASRGCMSELLFEAYGIPKICYGIDAMFSSYYNQNKGKHFITEVLEMTEYTLYFSMSAVVWFHI